MFLRIIGDFRGNIYEVTCQLCLCYCLIFYGVNVFLDGFLLLEEVDFLYFDEVLVWALLVAVLVVLRVVLVGLLVALVVLLVV